MRAEATDIAEDAGRDLKPSDHVCERIFELIVNGEFAEHARLPAETEPARRQRLAPGDPRRSPAYATTG